ncbi:hypothetical protein [Francisella frigiditurris]|uniref:Putative membrane protein n=1 Tax=Francisella frigiditurris TaxID=1542390 RepID=A0A1J0KTR9_9GAMM|nr:hypothetical protein [Francisella frigiditurris]APC97098.1 putative membrane protein [Francisella frigiditurris]
MGLGLRYILIAVFIGVSFVFIYFPITLILGGKIVSYQEAIVPFILLSSGFVYMMYFFNNIYLKKFDDKNFDKVFLYLRDTPEYTVEQRLIESFKIKISKNPILVKYFNLLIFNSFYDCFYIFFVSLVIKEKNKFVSGFATKFFRITFIYSRLYFLIPEMFDDKDCRKPQKTMMLVSVLSTFITISIGVCAFYYFVTMVSRHFV